MGQLDNVESKSSEHEVGLEQILSALWAKKTPIAGAGVFAGLLSVLVLSFIPNTYTATALLSPAEQSGGGMSAMMQQYGGLASIAGVSLPGEEKGTRAQFAIALLSSRQFLGDFVASRDILVDLMASDEWDIESKLLKYDDDKYEVDTGKWVRDVDPPFTAKPSRQEVHEAFLNIITVKEDQETGFVTLSIDHLSPVVAARWVRWLVEDVNDAVKLRDVEEAQRSIAYLEQQVKSTSVADLQVVFFELIQSQMETVMLAEVRPEYVFRVIDPALAPQLASAPKRAILMVLGVFMGMLIAIGATLSQKFYAESK